MAILLTALAILQASPACPVWKGYDADHKRDICGSSPRPVSEDELLAFEKRHLPDVKRSAEADIVYTCGLRSLRWKMAVQSRVEYPIYNDPVVTRLTDQQRGELREWQPIAKQSVFKIYGISSELCRSLIGSRLLLELDRASYDGLPQ